MAVKKDVCFLDGYHSLGYQQVELRKKSVDFIFGINDFNHDREALGQPEDAACMDAAVGAESQYAAQDSGPCQAPSAGFFDDYLIQQAAVAAVVFADKNPQQRTF